MLARVTILSRGPRGFLTRDRGTVMVDPGASALLDLAEHPAHDAWVKAGEVSVTPEPEGSEDTSRHPPPVRSTPRDPARRRG